MVETTTTTPNVCDCGHAPTPTGTAGQPGGTGGTGYARTHEGRTLCYPCAEASERADFLAAEPGARHFAYLASDERSVTTWTGGTLARVVRSWYTCEGFGGRTIRLHARDERGGWWSGRGPRDTGTYVKLRRLKREPC